MGAGVNLSGALDIVTTSLAATLAPLRVQAHGGRFTESELALLLGDAPCILVAVLNLTGYESRGRNRWQGPLRFAAYCLGADSPIESRNLWAMNAAIQIVDALPMQRWGRTEQEIKPPELASISADNLYTGYQNNLRVTLWAVAWTQTFIFDDGVSTP